MTMPCPRGRKSLPTILWACRRNASDGGAKLWRARGRGLGGARGYVRLQHG